MDDVERRIATLEKQHEDYEKRLNRIENILTRTDERYNNIMREIEKMSEVLEELKNKPAKNWGILVSSAISAIVGAIIASFIHGGL